MSDATPMLQQYRRLKARFPDAILLFRLGDFYEMFDADARLISRQLGLVLTARRFSKQERLDMCGVPFRQLTTYVARLLAEGHKVAVADQLENPSQARRLIKREIVRVVTPGTVVEEALLADKMQNFLAALATDVGTGAWGLAAVDLATGEFVSAQFEGGEAWAQLQEQLAVLQPSEFVLPATLADDAAWCEALASNRPARISPLEEAAFAPAAARDLLLRHFGVASLDPYGCEHLPLATAAAGAALHYLQRNQLSDLAHLRALETWHPEATVGLDAVTRRNLELTGTLRDGKVQGSLLGVLDRTVTAMGARLLRRWLQQPLFDLAAIHQRLDAVEEFYPGVTSGSTNEILGGNVAPRPSPPAPLLRPDLRTLLAGLYDVERIVGRIGFGTANARDLAALRRTLQRIPRIRAALVGVTSARLQALHAELDELQDVVALIAQALVDDPPLLLRDGGLIRRTFHPELNQLRAAAAEGRDWLAQYEQQERARTGIASLRVRYNEVFGFFVEVPRSKSGLLPPEYERRATISHAERFATPALKARESAIVAAEERADELEYDLFVTLRHQVAAHSDRLRRTARVLAELDVLAALAEVAAQQGYVRPMVDDSTAIEIVEGRHPVVEQLLPDGARFVPNDMHLDGTSRRLLIVTGPNMSGKSVVSRQVALLALLAQVGSFVPARAARIGLVDRIFVRAGASDDIAQGRSTFLVEMSETAYILRHATAASLVVLDEVGRGTSTYDGMALAWAVGEDLHNRIGARTLFATHFHELTALAAELPAAANASLAIVEQGEEVVFLYRLVAEGADRSYGVQVARLAGIPEHVVARARAVMGRLEGMRGSHAPPATAIAPAQGLEHTPAPDLLVPEGDARLWHMAREIARMDIANLTPVRALLLLNDLQQQLRGREEA